MSKEWKFIGSNAPCPKSKEENDKYHKKQFKWGLRLEKMEPNKPKVNYKSNSSEEGE